MAEGRKLTAGAMKRDADAMYAYAPETKFAEAMLEAQADIVGDYSEALWSRNGGARLAQLAGNMAGSGIYGL